MIIHHAKEIIKNRLKKKGFKTKQIKEVVDIVSDIIDDAIWLTGSPMGDEYWSYNYRMRGEAIKRMDSKNKDEWELSYNNGRRDDETDDEYEERMAKPPFNYKFKPVGKPIPIKECTVI